MSNPASTGARTELPLLGSTNVGVGGCCGGAGCGCSTPADAHTGRATTTSSASDTFELTDSTNEQQMSEQTTQTFQVSGMTCGHCASAVTDELQALDGVEAVEVDLVAGGTSSVRVQAQRPIKDDDVVAALDEAGGYTLA